MLGRLPWRRHARHHPHEHEAMMSGHDDLLARTAGQWWRHDETHAVVAVAQVRELVMAAYAAGGATHEDAEYLAQGHLDKALQGDHARGLGSLRRVLQGVRAGEIDLRPALSTVTDWPAAAIIDAPPSAIPDLVCRHGMVVAIEKAEVHGASWVGVRASGGALHRVVRQAVDRDIVGLAMTQSPPFVAPLGGYGPLLGNGPLAVGVPSRRHDPVILDMASTRTSASGVAVHAAAHRSVPPGLLLDREGYPTTDAAQLFNGGSLVPIGGHKGYALLFVISLLASVMTDTSFPWELFAGSPEPKRHGTLLIALNPLVVMPLDTFTDRVDAFIDHVKAAPRRPDTEEILYPGELSQRLRRERSQRGEMAIPASALSDLVAVARELGLPEPVVRAELPHQ